MWPIYICFRDMEHIFIKTTNTLKASGTPTKEVDGDECILLTALYTKANGSMIREMGKECCD